MSKGRAESIILSAMLIVASAALAFVITEVVLRFTSLRSFLPYEGMPRGYYVESRAQGYDIARDFATSTHRFADGEYSIWSNNIGCFDKDYGGEAPFIYLTGDSFAWGFTPFADKWGTVLENEIGMRVLKCGVPGYGTRQEYEKMTATLSSLPKPRAIVLSYFVNDESDDAAFPNSLVYEGALIKNLNTDNTKDYDALMVELPAVANLSRDYCMWNEPEHPTLQRAKCFLTRHSILYTVAKNAVKNMVSLDRLRAIGIANNPPEEREAAQEASTPYSYLSRFRSFADKRDVPLVVALVPPRESLAKDAADPYADVKKFMHREGIEFLDLRDSFRRAAENGATLYWPEDLHWNNEGNHLAGRLVSGYLISRGFASSTTER